jgi:RNase H-fold protein (predicted Holliday junction resolvase)
VAQAVLSDTAQPFEPSEATGEPVKKQRKPRKDKGIKRSSKSTKNTATQPVVLPVITSALNTTQELQQQILPEIKQKMASTLQAIAPNAMQSAALVVTDSDTNTVAVSTEIVAKAKKKSKPRKPKTKDAVAASQVEQMLAETTVADVMTGIAASVEASELSSEQRMASVTNLIASTEEEIASHLKEQREKSQSG